MAIPQHTIDQILDRIDIVELIGQRVKLKKTGRTYSGCCPFHQEKSPSFHVYRDKAYYHCFGCQANGNAIKFLTELEGRSFIDVMKDLSQRAGIELPKDDFSEKKATYQRKITPVAPAVVQDEAPTSDLDYAPFPDDLDFIEPQDVDHSLMFADIDADPFAPMPDDHNTEERTLYDLLEEVTTYYQAQLAIAPHAQNYFHNRALTQDTVNHWRLGYAPSDWQHLEKAFPQDIEGLKMVGLIRVNDKGKSFNLLRDRVIFPIRDAKGRVVGFGGRALNDEIKPKYINSPDSDVFHKNQLLYGLYEGRKNRAHDWLMVEGYMDVIALHQSGIHGAVATLGTASNADHLNILFKQNPRLFLAFDGDAAGQKAAWRTLEIALPLLNDGRELRFFILPERHDPDSLIRQVGKEAFEQQIHQSPKLSDYLFNQLTKRVDINSPEGKSQVMATLRTLTQQLPAQGTFKYTLTQAFKENLGFGRKKFEVVQTDKDLNFTSPNHTQLVIAMLLNYPILYPHFETLRAFTSHSPVLHRFLDTLDQTFDQLPDDTEASRYFLLGACHDLQDKLLPILNAFDLDRVLLIENPEEINRHAQQLSLNLKKKFLLYKSKNVASLKEQQNVMQQLNEVNLQISKTEIKDAF